MRLLEADPYIRDADFTTEKKKKFNESLSVDQSEKSPLDGKKRSKPFF